MARAHDPEIQAITGSLHYARDRDGKAIYNFAYPTFDYAASMYAVIGILSWLNQKDHGPVRVEVPLAAVGLAWMYPLYVNAVEFNNRDFANNNDWRGSYRIVARLSFEQHDDRPPFAVTPSPPQRMKRL